jgi:hypothetical protein
VQSCLPKRHGRNPICITGRIVNGRTLNRVPSLAICDNILDRGVVLRYLRSLELEEVFGIESVKCPKDMVALVDFLLASTNERELEVEEQTPEFGGSLGGIADGGDEVVVKRCVEGSTVGQISRDRDASLGMLDLPIPLESILLRCII